MKKKSFLSNLLCVTLVVLCSSLMPILLYFSNVGAIKFYEIAIFIGIYSLIGIGVFFALKRFLKSEYKAAVGAGVFGVIFQNTGRLTDFIPYVLVFIIFFLAIAGLIFVIKKYLNDILAKILVPALSIFLVIFLTFSTILSLNKITTTIKSVSETEEDTTKQYEYLMSFKDETKAPEKLPNIYFIIPDEYAGFASLKEFFDYDNSEFKAFLEDKNFSVSESSTNYSNGTLECLSDVFNLEVSEKNRYAVTSESYCREKLNNACLFRLATEAGYSVNVAQATYLTEFESLTEPYGDKWNSTNTGETVIDIMMEPSMIWYLADYARALFNGVPTDYFVGDAGVENHREAAIAPLLYFAEKENVGKENTFNFCYAGSPHQPFLFNADGTPVEDEEQMNNWADKENYLNQLKYCTTLLKNTINNIIENDPDSIIILMSDHGVRDHSEDKEKAEYMEFMTSKDVADILCAVYYKGEKFTDIEGMCGSNVVISVVNKALGFNIPLIEQSDEMYFSQ